jgi:hypothetical protein
MIPVRENSEVVIICPNEFGNHLGQMDAGPRNMLKTNTDAKQVRMMETAWDVFVQTIHSNWAVENI